MTPDLPRNTLKQALAEGRPQTGIWNCIRDPLVAEMLAGCGYDWMLIDCEHSPSSIADVLAHLQAIARWPISAMVRPTCLDPAEIKRLLDIGAQNILVPYIETVDQARLAAAAVAYPPTGIRGVAGGTRAGLFGAVPDYVRRARDEIGLFLQIETRAGLDRIEEIAAVPGVDGLFIGPADLATSMGHAGNSAHPEVHAAIIDGIRRIRAAGLPPGFLALQQGMAAQVAEAGGLFTAIAIDMGLLRRAALECLADISRDG